MKILTLLLALLFAVPAVAAEPPAAPKADMHTLMAQIAPLSESQKRELINVIRKQLPAATPAEKAAKHAASEQRWHSMTPEDRADYRSKYAAGWAKMDAGEKAVQREKIAERLRALPDADRAAIIQSLSTPSPK